MPVIGISIEVRALVHPRAIGVRFWTGGFSAGVLVAVVTAFIQARLAWSGGIATTLGWLDPGIRFGFGAMAGDAVKSFFKRRLGIEPGRPWIPAPPHRRVADSSTSSDTEECMGAGAPTGAPVPP